MEKKFKFILTEKQINNLLSFLDRVEIKGIMENQAFFEVTGILARQGEESEIKE